MKERLEKELDALPPNFVVLTILPNANYEELNMHMINLLTNKRKAKGGYITANRPYSNIIELMKKNDIDHNNLFFIDCVTEKDESADNCVFLKSSESLTNIGIALDPIYKSDTHSFIVLDSLDALSIYNKKKDIIRFTHELINKTRENKMSGIMVGLPEDADKEILDHLASFCDTVIDLTK
jgi:archaellum biogenesis ATPase FlaH